GNGHYDGNGNGNGNGHGNGNGNGRVEPERPVAPVEMGEGAAADSFELPWPLAWEFWTVLRATRRLLGPHPRILDAGSCSPLLAYHLASMGCEVHVVE